MSTQRSLVFDKEYTNKRITKGNKIRVLCYVVLQHP